MGQTPVAVRAPRLYPVPVKITIEGSNLEVHPSTVVLHKGMNEEVVWECPSGNFDVDFGNSTPFATNKFSQANAHSGPPTVGPSTNPYKYTVSAGGLSVDPDVIIQP